MRLRHHRPSLPLARAVAALSPLRVVAITASLLLVTTAVPIALADTAQADTAGAGMVQVAAAGAGMVQVAAASPNVAPIPPIGMSSTALDVMAAINHAHAAEGVPAIALPSNFSALTLAEQLFVLTNLERVARGVPPIAGLNAALDADALQGALAGVDPIIPVGSLPGAVSWGANWAGMSAMPLSALYAWMYQDGPGGLNEGCGSTGGATCYSHRENMLRDWAHLVSGDTGTAVMGAAAVRRSNGWSVTSVYADVTGSAPSTVFTWQQELSYLSGDAGGSSAASVTSVAAAHATVGLPYSQVLAVPVEFAGTSMVWVTAAQNGTSTVSGAGSAAETSIGDGLSLSSTGVVTGVPQAPQNLSIAVMLQTPAGATVSAETLHIDCVYGADVGTPGEYTVHSASIALNGATVSTPHSFVSSGTTYMPIWYVMQALQSIGIQSGWDGHNWTLIAPLATATSLTDISPGTGIAAIYLNGVEVQRENSIVYVDPASGQQTTYMPIWYVMQVLKRVGVASTWNGDRWNLVSE